MDHARDALDDFSLHHDRDLADARQSAASANLALDAAEDALADFLIDHSQRLARARDDLSKAELALGRARTALTDFDPRHARRLAAALAAKAKADADLDRAEDRLADFDLNYDEVLAAAQLAHSVAKNELDDANDAVSQLLYSAGRARAFDEDYLEDLRVLRAAAAQKLAAYNSAKDRLEDVEKGPDSLLKSELESAVELARASVEIAAKDLNTLQEGQGALEARQLSTAVALAEANMTKASRVVERLEDGPDPVEKERLEAAVALARAMADGANRKLEDLEDGPDALLRTKLEVDVAATQAALAVADKSLESILDQSEDPGELAKDYLAAAEVSYTDDTIRGLVDAALGQAGSLNAIGQPFRDQAGSALDAGADPWEVALRIAQVDNALVSLDQARDALADLGEGVDPRDRALLESQAALARANLDKAVEDLEDITTNIDPLLVAAAAKEVNLAEAALFDAETRLEAARGRVAPDMERRRADLAVAEQAAIDALNDLESSVITAPFGGVVFLVNAEPDDVVSQDSLIVRLVDDSVLEVEAQVDGADVSMVQPGAKATVVLDRIPDAPLNGAVTTVSEKPRTERGVLTYPVKIMVDAPAGLDLTLTGVSVIINP